MIKISIFVCAENDPDWVSRKIMKVIRADYSHIGIIVDDRTVYHMVGKGFSTMPLAELQVGHTLQLKNITNHIDNIQYALGYLEGRLGVEYSQSQYLGFLFPFLRQFVRNNREKGVCSEEVARFLLLCGKPQRIESNIHNLDSLDFVSPKDVWEALAQEI